MIPQESLFSPRVPTIEEAASRIEALDSTLNTFVRKRLPEALSEARARSREQPRSPLHGLPYGLKDMWDTVNLPTSGGSYRFRDRVPPRSAPVHRVFEEARAVLMGKTNLGDLGMALESGSYFGGPVNNPHDLKRTAGGSSGGAAAAVASGMLAFDWGTDFGGSIRLPAAFCGVFGMRLSSESWPVEGMFPSPPASLRSLNGQGPITPDLATMRKVLAVARPALRTGPVRPFSLRGAFLYCPEGLVARQWPSFEADVRPSLARAVKEVRDDHGLPSPWKGLSLSQCLYCSHFGDLVDADPIGFWRGFEAVFSSLLFRGRFGDKRFHPRTAEMLLSLALGRAFLYRDRDAALRAVNALRDHVSSLWAQGYLIAAPTCPFPAPPHGRALLMPFLPLFNILGNLVDATALAVPWGRFANGLPRSVQFWGPPGSEDVLLDVAEAFLADSAAS